MHSVIHELETEEIPRLRMGIGADNRNLVNAVQFVLSNFEEHEISEVGKMLDLAVDVVYSVVYKGFPMTMSLYNRSREMEDCDHGSGGGSESVALNSKSGS